MFYAMYPEFWIFCEKKIENFGYIRNFENFDFINFFGNLGKITSYNFQSWRQIMTLGGVYDNERGTCNIVLTFS